MYIKSYAGTGKTYTVNEIYKTLTAIGKTVVITCSTGIACTNYTNAYTIHRWSGINDGRYSSTELIARILGNASALERLKNTDVLISLKLFDQLVTLLTAVKNKSKFCGGIQLIVAGDFFQLPPVPNKHYNDPGDFCFNSAYFKQLHRVTLTDIVRQDDMVLIRAIREVSEGGDISENTVTYIKSLERPLSGTADTIKLYANNDLVNSFNRSQIEKHPGNIYEYVGVDKGDFRYLCEITAVPKLWLKIGCPVVLIRNLSNVLVNGLQGKVVGFSSDGPVVHFNNNITTTINKVSFTVFSRKDNTILAERLQIPLLLSYALTVHKSQGMTLDRVEVDCQQMFKAGQLGVAMGRIKNSDGLRVVNFNRNMFSSTTRSDKVPTGAYYPSSS